MSDWIDAKFPCPTKHKVGGRSTKIINWCHSSCSQSGKLELNMQCDIRCKKCQNADKLWDWRFNCGDKNNHDVNHDGGFLKVDHKAAISAAMCALGSFNNSDKEYDFFVNMMVELGRAKSEGLCS